MDSWQRFNKTSLPDKKEFYSNLTMEGITDADYSHAKRVWEGLEYETHDLHTSIMMYTCKVIHYY